MGEGVSEGGEGVSEPWLTLHRCAQESGKALMNLIGEKHGIDVGSVRLPYSPATAAQLDAIGSAAKGWCAFGAPWCADL